VCRDPGIAAAGGSGYRCLIGTTPAAAFGTTPKLPSVLCAMICEAKILGAAAAKTVLAWHVPVPTLQAARGLIGDKGRAADPDMAPNTVFRLNPCSSALWSAIMPAAGFRPVD